MKKVRFAGLSLKSPIGLSSDNVILNKNFLKWLKENNVGIIFTPTLINKRNKLEDEKRRYAKIQAIEIKEDEYIFVTRPLSFTMDEFLNKYLKDFKELHQNDEEINFIASITGRKLNEIVDIIEKIEQTKIFSAYEIDTVLFQVLFNNRRGLFEYSIDLIDEILSIINKPLLVKIPVMMALNTETINDLLKTDINGIIISPHPIYNIGSHIFRVHSSAISHIDINILAKVLTQFEEIDIGYIDDSYTSIFDRFNKPFIYRIFNTLLYDISYLLLFREKIAFFKKELGEFPIRWVSLPKDFTLLVDSRYLNTCSKICPFDAIPEVSEENTAEVTEQCVFCGLCLSLCSEKAVKKAKIFSPI